MKQKIMRRMALLLLLSSTRLFAGADQSDSLVAAAWKAWEKNDQPQVEQIFLAAVQADPKNTRAHLGLSFLYAYQEKHEAAWLAFKNILQTEENFYPYIYSVWLTPKLRRSLNNPQTGAVELLENLATQADAAGILKAMANDVLGEHYQAKSDLSKSRQFYQNVNAVKDWMLIGPFENVSASGFDNVYPPEAEYDAAKTYLGKNGIPVKWFKIAATRNDGWIDHRRYFVFSNDGLDAFKEYWIGYNSYLEGLTIEKAVVIKGDGAEIEADVQGNHVVFKSLEKNDFVYLKWRLKEYYTGKLASHFWDTFYFNSFYPGKNVRYALLAPEHFKFQFKGQNMPAEPVKTATDDGVLYQWSLTDEPAIEYESGMPPLDDVGKVLHISSIANWEYLVEWYSDLARTKTRASYEIKEQVAKLFDGKPNLSDEEKIETIYHFITENIRYSSVPFRQSALMPQKARNALVNKIGDCKDVATLCIAMLEAAGIKAHYVLVNTRNEGQNKNVLPSISFNHCLAGVETKTGVKYLDLTAYNYPFGSVPAPDVEGFSLLMKPGVKAPSDLSRHDFIPNNILRHATIEIRDDLSIAASVRTRKAGMIGASMREYYRDKGQKEREKGMAEALSKDFPNVVLTKLEMENLDELAPAVRYVCLRTRRFVFPQPFLS